MIFEKKFRAWDEKQEYLAYQGTPDLETLKSFMFHFGDNVLMLYTGFKDINGVEIYEGDILECHEYDSSDCGHRIVQTFKNAVVGFHMGSFHYYPKGRMNAPHQLLMYAYKPKIIGNIYQDKNLI